MRIQTTVAKRDFGYNHCPKTGYWFGNLIRKSRICFWKPHCHFTNLVKTIGVKHHPGLTNTHQATNSFLTLCTVLIPFPVSFATSRMAYPLFKRLITSLYSSLFLSWDLVEPVGLPSLPPFSTYCFLPEFSRNEVLSRSNRAQVERVAIMTGANKDGLPSLSRSVNCSFWI